MAAENSGDLLWVGSSGGMKRNREGPVKGSASTEQHTYSTTTTATGASQVSVAALCARITQHVMQRELGGRHNAAYYEATEDDGGSADAEEMDNQRALQLEVELCRPTQAALSATLTHVLRYRHAAEATHSHQNLALVQSATRYERVQDDVTVFRKGLHVCWDAVDIVGGLTGGATPAVRAYCSRLVHAGLRGQRPPRRDAADHGRQTAEEKSHAMDQQQAGVRSTLQALLHDSDDSDAEGGA